jgi:hypothetical protein
MESPLPPGDYFALIARAERRPDCDVFAWTVRDRLPTIPVPLLAPDADLPYVPHISPAISPNFAPSASGPRVRGAGGLATDTSMA